MSKSTKTDQEIDKIVDEIVADEDTANALKDKLHQKLETAEAKYVRPEAGDDDDADDMWDNMPV
ncbi:hypothetical protein [Celeribacter neptunius]|uniref:Uncharacterized protein n=1 Tax=Celeribacter neptunius TaxID=588602 RepID=A0A1I3M3Z8_9RHOB|nr:hypothetical protein [Celeribacter neptunius]SFI91647.1 hypothetical protein SAMN04487991_1236 [Celeribacter neptunius]